MPQTKRVHKTGLPPGSLLYTGTHAHRKVVARQYLYHPGGVISRDAESGSLACTGGQGKCWTEVRGLHDLDLMEKIGKELGLSALMLEDILNVRHAPALSTANGTLLLSLKYIDWETSSLPPVHVNLLLSGDLVLSFADSDKPLFEAVARRLEDERNLLRTFGADHLFLRLVDLITDHYLPALQALRDDFDRLLEGMMQEVHDRPLPDIIALHRRVAAFRPVVLP
ncbi:MAG TPA: CorA family divalent cation transporter, partial [Bacteroidales bacterium]|nr:CorA family divalent cation transporter [Bacteroidales bacterium]